MSPWQLTVILVAALITSTSAFMAAVFALTSATSVFAVPRVYAA
jgi:hypothetical protein